MRTALAPTSVGMTPDQNLLVKDVYSVVDSAENTSVIDVLKDVSSDITKVLRTTPGVATKITQLALDARSGRLDTLSVASRIGSLLKGSSTLDKLNGHVMEGLTNTFGMSPELSTRVMTTVVDGLGNPQSVLNQVKAFSNVNNASSVINSINRLLGNKDVIEQFDLGGEAALIGELLNQAVRAGIPSAIDVLIRNAGDDYNRRTIISRNITPIMFSGDVTTMEAMLKYVAPSSIASMRPNFAQEFLGNFKMPIGTKKAEYLGYKTRILSLLDNINPNWPVGLRGNEVMYTLEPFSRMSKDAKLVFAMSDDYLVQSIIADKFMSRPAHSLIKSQYPYFPV